MLQEMTIHVGDPVDAAKIEASRQAIMNLGLFKKVQTELLPDGHGKILQIAVQEKLYILPYPRLNRNADGDISYGAGLRWNNIAGLNQQLKLNYETMEPTGANMEESEEISFQYEYPRIRGGPYNVNFSLSNISNKVNVFTEGMQTAEYEHQGYSVNVSLSRFLAVEGPSQGWRVGGGLVWREDYYDHISGTPSLYPTVNTAGWIGLVDYTNVRDYLYSRAGESYGYELEWGSPGLGSDYQYRQHHFYWRQYLLVTERPHYSLDWQVQVGLSQGYPGDVFSLGNSSTLRGYARNSITGKAYVLANIEYLAPLFGYNSFRGLLFLDVGNGYPRNSDIDLTDLRASVGIGLRMTLESFVKIQLRLDYGYALRSGDSKGYAGSKDTF